MSWVNTGNNNNGQEEQDQGTVVGQEGLTKSGNAGTTLSGFSRNTPQAQQATTDKTSGQWTNLDRYLNDEAGNKIIQGITAPITTGTKKLQSATQSLGAPVSGVTSARTTGQGMAGFLTGGTTPAPTIGYVAPAQASIDTSLTQPVATQATSLADPNYRVDYLKELAGSGSTYGERLLDNTILNRTPGGSEAIQNASKAANQAIIDYTNGVSQYNTNITAEQQAYNDTIKNLLSDTETDYDPNTAGIQSFRSLMTGNKARAAQIAKEAKERGEGTWQEGYKSELGKRQTAETSRVAKTKKAAKIKAYAPLISTAAEMEWRNNVLPFIPPVDILNGDKYSIAAQVKEWQYKTSPEGMRDWIENKYNDTAWVDAIITGIDNFDTDSNDLTTWGDIGSGLFDVADVNKFKRDATTAQDAITAQNEQQLMGDYDSYNFDENAYANKTPEMQRYSQILKMLQNSGVDTTGI